MKIHYNEDADLLTIVVRDEPVARTVELEYGIVDLDSTGDILAVEVMGASDIISKALYVAAHPSLESALAQRAKALLADVSERIADSQVR